MRRYKRLTPGERRKLIERHCSSKVTIAELAKEFGVGTRSVSNILAEEGVGRGRGNGPYRRWSKRIVQ